MKLLMHFIDFRTAAFLIWPERRQDSSRNPKGILPDNVRAEIKNLIINSVAPSTSKTYLHGLEIFDKFRKTNGLCQAWPIPLCDAISFITYMYKMKLSHSTVSCYVSGLSFFL